MWCEEGFDVDGAHLRLGLQVVIPEASCHPLKKKAVKNKTQAEKKRKTGFPDIARGAEKLQGIIYICKFSSMPYESDQVTNGGQQS